MAESVAYQEYERLLLELHRLDTEGLGDSPEYDQVIEKMDRPWSQLTSEEMERLGKLSASLRWTPGKEGI